MIFKKPLPIFTDRKSFATFVAETKIYVVMNDQDLKLIIAQQVVILKRLEKLEQKVNGGLRSAPAQSYVEELKKEAMKIINQITI